MAETTRTVSIRCDDHVEGVSFTVFSWDKLIIGAKEAGLKDFYELNFEDAFVGDKLYRGLFGRIRRAWRAFCSKPVTYTGICIMDKEKMQKFFLDCLKAMEDDAESE